MSKSTFDSISSIIALSKSPAPLITMASSTRSHSSFLLGFSIAAEKQNPSFWKRRIEINSFVFTILSFTSGVTRNLCPQYMRMCVVKPPGTPSKLPNSFVSSSILFTVKTMPLRNAPGNCHLYNIINPAFLLVYLNYITLRIVLSNVT